MTSIGIILGLWRVIWRARVGKTWCELDACASSLKKKRLASKISSFSLFLSTNAREIVVFPMLAISFIQNKDQLSSQCIHAAISPNTPAHVFLKHVNMQHMLLSLDKARFVGCTPSPRKVACKPQLIFRARCSISHHFNVNK